MAGKVDIALAVFVLAACGVACSGSPELDCAHDRKARNWAAAIVSCERELERTSDPRRAIDAAFAAYYLRRPADELRFATRALAGGAGVAADASYYAGHAEFVLADYRSAAHHLELAATLYAQAGNASAAAGAQQLRAGAWAQLGDYARALDADEAARAAAVQAQDARMVLFVDLARARILRDVGDLRAAEAVVELALGEAREPADRVLAQFQRGILHIDQGHPALARAPLTEALAAETAAAAPRGYVIDALHLNLAFVARKAQEFSRALEELELASRAGTDRMSYRLNRGLVFADMGRLAEAGADLDAAEAEHPGGAWAWWVAFQRAKVAARSRDLPTAIAADQLAIERVARVAAKAGGLGPTVIAKHREPHLHLIGLLAQDHSWIDVLEVVAMMDGQSLLDSREPAFDAGPTSALEPPESPAASEHARPWAPNATARAVDAWRGRRLVIVVPGGDRVWRLDVRDGQVTGRDVGDATALAALARQLETDPGDAFAGRVLGQAFLPPALALRERIALLVIGPLSRAPLGGLRAGGRLAVASYELTRAPGLLPRAAAIRPNERGGSAIVVGDPTGNLPAAAVEADRVAHQLHGVALIGAEATRAAFTAVAGASLLHVAAHTVQRRDGATLELADGSITLADIAALAPAPRLVVLASCGAAAGRDDAGNGSLANAFLEAGADAVVGTRWSVDDADAARFVAAFYASGGARDPVRALGDAQLGSKLPATTWAAFEVSAARPIR